MTGSITIVAPQPDPRGSVCARSGAGCSKSPATHATANKWVLSIMVPAFELVIAAPRTRASGGKGARMCGGRECALLSRVRRRPNCPVTRVPFADFLSIDAQVSAYHLGGKRRPNLRKRLKCHHAPRGQRSFFPLNQMVRARHSLGMVFAN